MLTPPSAGGLAYSTYLNASRKDIHLKRLYNSKTYDFAHACDSAKLNLTSANERPSEQAERKESTEFYDYYAFRDHNVIESILHLELSSGRVFAVRAENEMVNHRSRGRSSRAL